ncbi:MAG: alpha/beta hydrolase [Planctomycetota bacterium]
MPTTSVSRNRDEPPLAAAWRRVEGAGPELVYVPGIDGSGDMLLDTRERLARHFRLGCLRFRLNEARDPAGAYAALAASIVTRLDEEHFERPLILAESFGVAVALRLALDHPERVRGLALVNGFARYPNPVRLRIGRCVARGLPDRLFRLGRRVAVQFVFLSPRHDPDVLRRFSEIERLRMDAGYRFRMAMIQSVDLVPELQRIDCPTVVFASDSDRIVPSLATGEELVARIPDARLERISHAGHLVLPFPEEPWVERLEALDRRASRQPPQPEITDRV